METNVEVRLEHSGLGIAAFVLGLLSFFLLFVLLIFAGCYEASAQSNLSTDAVFGALYFLVVAIALTGLIFGIVAVCQTNVKKVFGIIGLVLSVVVVLFAILILLLGLSMVGD